MLQYPLNYVAINAKIAQREINIVSIYLSLSQVITSAQLDHFFRQIPHPCLILGDFNVQHTAWGCHANNNSGQTLHTLLDQHHLALLKGTNPALKKPSNIPEIYPKMFGRIH